MDQLLESLLSNKIFEDEFDDVFKPMSWDEYAAQQEGWIKNKDGSYDVEGYVDLHDMRLERLPLRFRNVSGYFYCGNNQLITLEGAPKEVGKGFNCKDNNLITLEGGPEYVGGDFDCHFNNLTNLIGAPKKVRKDFDAVHNKLTTLEGAPKYVGGTWFLEGNPVSKKELLKTLEK